MVEGGHPGLAARIIKNGRVVWSRTYGLALVDPAVPVTDDTLFMLGSVSKTITAVAVLQLWEDGYIIDLDDDVNEYLPFPVVNPHFPEVPITFRMLLTFTSGIKDNEGMLLGSVSTEVLRHGETDLLVIRHKILPGEGAESPCRDIFSRVMLTTDFSSAGGEATGRAKELPGVREILLVNVIERDDDFDEAAARLNRLREELAAPGRKVTVHVLQGHPSQEILALAVREDVSLIMISSQGKSWSRQIRVGSTAFDVVRQAESPVFPFQTDPLFPQRLNCRCRVVSRGINFTHCASLCHARPGSMRGSAIPRHFYALPMMQEMM